MKEQLLDFKRLVLLLHGIAIVLASQMLATLAFMMNTVQQ